MSRGGSRFVAAGSAIVMAIAAGAPSAAGQPSDSLEPVPHAAGVTGRLVGVTDEDVLLEVRGWKQPVRVPRTMLDRLEVRRPNEAAATTLQIVAGTGTT